MWEDEIGKTSGHNGEKEITAQQIREKFKISYSAINHYTDLGLFAIVRKSGNKRVYDLNEVKSRFQIISRLANEGYPLHLIRKKIMEKVTDELL